MSSTLSPKMNVFKASASLAVSEKVATLRAEGKEIISLNIGEPDFPTPEHIKEAGIRAIQENYTKYVVGSGLPELRSAIAKKLNEENGIPCTAEEIAVSVGAKQALMSALTAICGEGDEVIIPTPCYVSYPDMVKLAGGTPVFVPLDQTTYEPDVEAIRNAITPNTKALILCTPNNPTGAVYEEKDLRAIAQLAIEHDFFVIADEVYEKLVFGKEHFSIASVSEEARQHTITVNGFSKTYCMTGWRIGYASARRDVIAAINKIQSQQTTCVSGFIQKAAIAALTGPQEEIETMRRSFEERMNYVHGRLTAMPHITCPKAGGAFYLFADVSHYMQEGTRIDSDTAFCNYLLEEAGIALMPGTAYYKPGTVRLSYAISKDDLKQAMDQMESALSRL